MASIGNDANGRKRILFLDPRDGKRKTVRLGKCDKRTAQAIAIHIEALLAAQVRGLPIPPDTATWLKELHGELREKLVKLGLVEAPKCMTLGEFLRAYLERHTHVKEASRGVIAQTVRNLLTYFGEDCRIDSITAGQADDFRKWLLAGGRSPRQPKKPKALAPATVHRRLGHCRSIFADAVRQKLIAESPFAGIKRPEARNRDRQAYVPADVIERLIREQAPSAEWRLLLALARYLGLRVPSEPFSLTWDCVDWEKLRLRVPSPKTARSGKGFRVVPILPQVLPYLQEVWDQAPEGSIYIFHHLRQRESAKAADRGFWGSVNLRTHFLRMLKRAGIRPWPRLWHNLRASAQTDLANTFPDHVVCEWLGNTAAVAQDHYLQVTDAHFDLARQWGGPLGAVPPPTRSASCLHIPILSGGTESGTQAAQFAAQQNTEVQCAIWRRESQELGIEDVTHRVASSCSTVPSQKLTLSGFEPEF
ncbi:MAG: tyrosine-type recombinase/integrase [Thermogemmata sp.]